MAGYTNPTLTLPYPVMTEEFLVNWAVAIQMKRKQESTEPISIYDIHEQAMKRKRVSLHIKKYS